MDWSVFFDFLGAGGGLMVLLKWLSDLPFVRLRLKGEREDAFPVSYTHLTLPTKA